MGCHGEEPDTGVTGMVDDDLAGEAWAPTWGAT